MIGVKIHDGMKHFVAEKSENPARVRRAKIQWSGSTDPPLTTQPALLLAVARLGLRATPLNDATRDQSIGAIIKKMNAMVAYFCVTQGDVKL